jgi:hypothetical protein
MPALEKLITSYLFYVDLPNLLLFFDDLGDDDHVLPNKAMLICG